MDENSTRSWSRLSQLTPPPAWRFALLVFLVMRISLSIWMWSIRQVFPQSFTPDPVLRPYLGVVPETNPWLEPWQRWDVFHYQAIAERGYQAFGGALFTPPFYPLLVRFLTALSATGSLLAGILISNLAFLACLAIFYDLVEKKTGNKELARRSLIYLGLLSDRILFSCRLYGVVISFGGGYIAVLGTTTEMDLGGCLGSGRRLDPHYRCSDGRTARFRCLESDPPEIRQALLAGARSRAGGCSSSACILLAGAWAASLGTLVGAECPIAGWAGLSRLQLIPGLARHSDR